MKVLGVEVADPPANLFKTISGRRYLTVAGRLIAFRSALAGLGYNPYEYSVTTELLPPAAVGGGLLVAKVTLDLPWGEAITAHSAVSPDGKGVEGSNPVEVAETSALGRALGFVGIDEHGAIETADGMEKAGYVAPAGEQAPASAPAAGSGFRRFGGQK